MEKIMREKLLNSMMTVFSLLKHENPDMEGARDMVSELSSVFKEALSTEDRALAELVITEYAQRHMEGEGEIAGEHISKKKGRPRSTTASDRKLIDLAI
ncbi:MAG: hypothetical protein WBC74_06005 [Candidatus Omnitrophota bacterium]